MAEEGKKKVTGSAKKWYEIAEVRMVLYVVPVGIAMALIGFVLSQVAGR